MVKNLEMSLSTHKETVNNPLSNLADFLKPRLSRDAIVDVSILC